MLEEQSSAYHFVPKSIFLMALNFQKDNLKVIYSDSFSSQDILINLELSHVKLFNNHFHLKQNYEKAIGPYFSEVSLLINRMMNTSSQEIFDKYMTELLKYSEGKTSLFQLVNEMIETKDSFVAYTIDHTPGSCCQRGSTRLQQNYSSVLSHIGKDFTYELKEVLSHRQV